MAEAILIWILCAMLLTVVFIVYRTTPKLKTLPPKRLCELVDPADAQDKEFLRIAEKIKSTRSYDQLHGMIPSLMRFQDRFQQRDSYGQMQTSRLCELWDRQHEKLQGKRS